ncbi:MAG: pyridoxamine 5'-phosphate oxidase [Sphaerobacteraceae bacterium]|nr:MAG: pyridoxamine 5'-phosphate oxidase [Sphaerobacteraceae bacterium]
MYGSTMGTETQSRIELPADVEQVLDDLLTAEVSTVGKDGTPITWPVVVQYRRESADFLLCTSIGMPGKIFNLRRSPKISLSYTDPTGSGLVNPPKVLVQGTAELDSEVRTSVDGVEDFWVNKVMGPQPASKMMSSNPLMRWYMDVYYMRIYITVTPTRICWWPSGDYSEAMQSIEVNSYVG